MRSSQRLNIWVHVDAAYAGTACICLEFRHFLDGIEGANSFTLNAHKWFFTTLDCCCLWVKDPSALIISLSTNPAYLRNQATDSKQVPRGDYKTELVRLDNRFEVVAPRNFVLVCFRVLPKPNVKKVYENVVANHDEKVLDLERVNELNQKLLDTINRSGHVYMSPNVVDGVYIIQCAVRATLTEERRDRGLEGCSRTCRCFA
nr:tyrosine/dopa decarboxylase 2 [Quercus suber]